MKPYSERRLPRGKDHPAYRHGLGGTPIYQSWRSMRNRCENERCPAFKDYGGRGITVCPQWSDFVAFNADMGASYFPHASLERIDNDGNYEPTNCKWIPRSEQAKNRRMNHVVEHEGISDTIAGWARRLGIRGPTLRRRLIIYGMTPAEAFQNKNLSGRKSKPLKPSPLLHGE